MVACGKCKCGLTPVYMSGLNECVCLSPTAKSDGGATGRRDPRTAQPRGSGPGPPSWHDATPSTFQRPAHPPGRHGIRARHRHPLDGLAHGMSLPVTPQLFSVLFILSVVNIYRYFDVIHKYTFK